MCILWKAHNISELIMILLLCIFAGHIALRYHGLIIGSCNGRGYVGYIDDVSKNKHTCNSCDLKSVNQYVREIPQSHTADRSIAL